MAFRTLTDYITPVVIEGMLQDKLWASMVAKDVIVTTSQPALGTGSSYKVPGTGDFTLYNYNGNAIAPVSATQTNSTIDIDQYPFINFYLEDSDVYESAALNLVTAYTEQAGMQIAESVDKFIFTTLYGGAQVNSNLGVTTSAVAINDNNVLTYVEDFAATLRENNITSNGVIVLPEWLGVKFAKAIGVNAYNQGVNGAIETGFVSRMFGFEIYTSNNLPTGVAGGLASGEYGVVGGKRDCFQFVAGRPLAKSGSMVDRPAQYFQLGQVYGCDYTQPLGWYRGVVKKA